MKALLVSCFGYYELRLKYVEKVLVDMGYEVYVVFSDYEHILKKKVCYENNNLISIEVPKYKRNISVKRIYSHLVFSNKVKKLFENEQPDLIYAMIPPNTLSNSVMSYKKANPKCRCILDVYDLWPESFPFRIKSFKLLQLWSDIRNNNLKRADVVILECNYYRDVLDKYLLEEKTKTLYICKENLLDPIRYSQSFDSINFCYLGSMNNIFDIPLIVSILKEINAEKKVVIHIIGDGEKKLEFLEKLTIEKISYKYYGKIFDLKQKVDIFAKCHFGINIYNENISVGLTMKSLDYFQAGLPVITMNIKDTGELVEKYGAGFEYKNDKDRISCIANINREKWQRMHKNTQIMFEKEFTNEICEKKLVEILNFK